MDNKKTPLSRLTSVLEGFEKSLLGFMDRQASKRRDLQILLDQALAEKEHIFRQYNQAVEDVDRILMQLEVTRRERDVALRNQGLSAVQKQSIARLERDTYRVAEALERVSSIREDVRKMLGALSENIIVNGQDISVPEKSSQKGHSVLSQTQFGQRRGNSDSEKGLNNSENHTAVNSTEWA